MKILKNSKGFSLTEVLVAVLIMAMVTGVVAAGMPAAIRAYRNIVDVANAQLLATTTTNTLRNELDMASNFRITSDSTEGPTEGSGTWGQTSIIYDAADGTSTRILSEAGKPVTIQEYYNYDIQAQGAAPYIRPLVTEETASGTMHVEIHGATAGEDSITLNGIKVLKGDKVLVNIDEFIIKTEKTRNN